MLDFEQRKILRQVLERVFASSIEDFRTFLKDKVNQDLDAFATGNLRTLRSRVIEEALAREWILDLLEALRNEVEEHDMVETRKLLDRIGPLEEIRAMRFIDTCMADRYPLVNRSGLRGKLRDVIDSKGPRILLIKGSRGTGNSHSLHHIRHVSFSLGIALAEISLREYPELTAIDFAKKVASKLRAPMPELDPKPARARINLLEWIGGLVDADRRLWLAIDDFEEEKRARVPLSSDARELIHMLYEKVGGEWNGVRLFLINYDREHDLPRSVSPRKTEELVPHEVSDTELITFFVDFYRENNVRFDDHETAAKDAYARATEVRRQMSGNGSTAFEAMRDAVVQQCDAAKRGSA